MYGNKVMALGFGLSSLGLGFFLPVVTPAGAILIMVGAVMVLLDK